ncbi:MAG: MBL fold metallo-hydrolase [Balneola sp.]|nr:MBL fold metallo-hydrolase [Balneola sp.]MBO6649437.1 MBL fold metallo-hydrolase [Balneola sp.]MBO6711252.1 MBL fold metallo-hydrolase [Balneola sp.]MBO6800633.1 MBL fold metallo-hydrolase [Balneola sp.]MBO6869187.1 MBL fold metallo-hydrolase [Balneola sp.]
MDIKIFEVGPFAENTYLLMDGGSAILIDPGFSNETEYQSFKSALKESTLEAIVLTHSHVDHVLGLQRVLKDFDIKVYVNTDDLFLWENFGSQATMFGLNQVAFSFTPESLPKDEEFEVGGFKFECLYTPGHSPDHTSLYFKDEDIVIAGDALFNGSIGRTDLYQGSFEVLEQSIKEKLYTLPDNTKVYPGHGPATTIEAEKAGNPFVKG